MVSPVSEQCNAELCDNCPAYLVPESVEHDGVQTDNENQRQEVAENKETSLMDYQGVRIISLWFVVRVEQSRSESHMKTL